MDRLNGSVTARRASTRNYPQNGPSTSDTDDQNSTYSSLNRRNPRLPAYAFILPNLEKFSEEFRRFVEQDIIEISTLRRLEASGYLNWWCGQNPSQRLLPLITQGDGNCLLHAASLGIWGVHDRQLNLRQLLYEALTASEKRSAFYRRWRWHESKSNLQSELILSEIEWKKEWNSVLDLAAPTPRVITNENGSPNGATNEQIYESLELIHVYALANVLKRPIIVVADEILRNANGESLSPVPFGGIYLPLELTPQQCHRSPLVLCYDSSHFSPLVAIRQATSNHLQAAPITDRNRNLLTVHFAVDPGPRFNWWRDQEDQRIAGALDAQQTDAWRLELIGQYMDIVKMDLRRGSVKKTTPMQNGAEFTPAVPIKLLTLASGNESGGQHKSRIFTEIRQHFRWLSRRKKKYNRPIFSAEELRQSNCVLTVLLHNFPHAYIDSMLNNYLNDAKQRFENNKETPSALTPKNRNRISRSFSLSSANLTCLNGHCNKLASPSTNFLCSSCYEDQKREMISIGSSTNTSPNSSSLGSHQENAHALSPPSTTRTNHTKSSTMPSIASAATSNNRAYYDATHHRMEAPIRYVDESTSASSTVSSRNDGSRRLRSPTTAAALTRYFYEKDDGEEVTYRPYAASFDYGIQPPAHALSYAPTNRHISPANNSYGGRLQSPPASFYNGPHSLPRVSLSSQQQQQRSSSSNYGPPMHNANHHLINGNTGNAVSMTAPNVSCIKTCSASNGLKNKVPSNGVSFYYAAS